MKRTVALALVLLPLLTACASNSPIARQGRARDLTEGYSLLYTLMKDEGKVDGILMVKSASDETEQLIRDIGETSRQMVETMDGWNRGLSRDRIGLDYQGLPKIEADARGNIAGKTGRELLFSDHFELRLLLTQSEATRYAVALAEELAHLDEDEKRTEDMNHLAETMAALRDRVLQRIAALPAETEKES